MTSNAHSVHVKTFSGKLQFHRNYVLFGLIAGVRSSVNPIFPPRGLPKSPPMSYMCRNEMFQLVVEDTSASFGLGLRDARGAVSRSEAERLILAGATQYTDASSTKIFDPNFHTPTWLTLRELLYVRKLYLLENVETHCEIAGKLNVHKQKVLDFINSNDEHQLMSYAFSEFDDPHLYATLCAMSALERQDDDTETRFVCWFDS